MKKVFLFLCAAIFCGTMSAEITEATVAGNYVVKCTFTKDYEVCGDSVAYFSLVYDDFEEEIRLVKVANETNKVEPHNYCTLEGNTLTIEPYSSGDYTTNCYNSSNYRDNCHVTVNEDGTLTFVDGLVAVGMSENSDCYWDFVIPAGAIAARSDYMPDPKDETKQEEVDYTVSIADYASDLSHITLKCNGAKTVAAGKYGQFYLIDGEGWDYDEWDWETCLASASADATSVDGDMLTINFGEGLAPVDGHQYLVLCLGGSLVFDGKVYNDPDFDYDSWYSLTYSSTTGIGITKTTKVDAMYNLQGCKVASLRAGQLYIKNGRKYISK